MSRFMFAIFALIVSIPHRQLRGSPARNPALRALHTDDAIYILAEWPDATRSDMRDPYIWNAEKKEYERPTTPDDQFALEFPLEGELLINMLPTEGEYVADVWHWKAGRSNLGGWVDGKRHIISQSRLEGAKQYAMGGHNTVYIARPMDSGRPAYVTTPKPTILKGSPRSANMIAAATTTVVASTKPTIAASPRRPWTTKLIRTVPSETSNVRRRAMMAAAASDSQITAAARKQRRAQLHLLLVAGE